MNTSRLLQQQQQQQQQYAASGPGPFPVSASTNNLMVPLGRPLPKTPGNTGNFPLPPPVNGSAPTNDYSSQQQHQQQQSGAVGRSTPPATTKRYSNANIHTAQPGIPSTPGSNSSYPSIYSHRQNKSWVQPKTTGSAISVSASSTNLVANQSAANTGFTSPTSISSSNNTYAGRRLSMQDELVSPSYHQALTRPISPSAILNYNFPPATATSADASVASGSSMSSNHTGIPPSSTVAISTSSLTPTMPATQALQPSLQTPQSYSTSSTTSTPGTGEYGGNMKRNLGYHTGAYASSNSLLNNRQSPSTPAQSPGTTSPTPHRHSVSGPSATGPAVSTIPGRYLQQQNRRGPLLPMNDDSSSPREGDLESTANSSGGSSYPHSLPGASIQIAKEGWLWRRGNLLTWKRCYAIGRYRGDGQPGMLTLFKDNEHMFPIKAFDLADCYEVQVKSADAKGTTRFEFKLVTRKEETWFGTDTMMERTGWIDALNSLMTAKGANVGTSLSKLEAKLNTIRHRNNSHEYTTTTPPSSEFHLHKRQISAGPAFGATSTMPLASTASIPSASMPHAGLIEEQLQIMQQELQTREQVLSKRELEIEQKRIESLLAQLKAWRSACKVTVNQQYAVRDQLLEKFMKTPRTVQDLVERSKIHLDAGADQILQMVTSHWDCLIVYDAGGSGLDHSASSSNSTTIILGLHRQLFRELKQVLLDLTINLDTRCSEIQRALLVIESHLSSFNYRDKRNRRRSESVSSSRSGAMTPEQTISAPPLSISASAAAEESLKSIRRKYTDTLEALKDLSQKIKAGLGRQQQTQQEVDEATMTSFREEMRDHLKSLRLPTFAFVPCIPDQPLLFNPLTGQSNETPAVDQHAKPSTDVTEEQHEKAESHVQPGIQGNTLTATTERPAFTLSSKEAAGTPAPSSRSQAFSPMGPRQSPFEKKDATTSRPISMVLANDDTTDTSPLPLPKGLSMFLLSQTSSPSLAPETMTAQPPPSLLDPAEMTQKVRDLVMPEFDHLSVKQQEMLKSLTTLLSDLSNSLMSKLGEIKEASQAQRQEFDELKDEIIDVMQLSATDPSNTQRDMSALSDIRSKLADISNQLTTVQKGSTLNFNNNGSFVLGRSGGGGVGGGASGLQRSVSTMIHHPSGHFSQYQTVDGSFRGRESGPMVAGSGGTNGGLDGIYGRASAFGNVLGPRVRGGNMSRVAEQDATEVQRPSAPSPEIVSKLDHLLLLLEFVNTAQCRLMAYQELDHERHTQTANIDNGRMLAVQEHMEEMDRKMNLQVSLLGRLLHLQDADPQNTEVEGSSAGARLTEIQDDDQNAESVLREHNRMHDLVPLSQFTGAFSATDSLTLAQVLERLEIDLIPSFKAQEERVQELSGHITELQKQIQEQQYHQQQQQNTPLQRTQSNTSRHRILTNDSTSARTGTPQSPLEPDSPAFWRASLRPSQSNGSTIAKERRGTLTHCASSPSLPGSSSTSSLTTNTNSPVLSPMPSYKTSDRILEIVERLDARFNQTPLDPTSIIVERDSERQPQHLVEHIQEAVSEVKADNKALLQNLKSLVTEQIDQNELTQVGNKALLKEIMTSLSDLHGHRAISSQAQQQWLKELKSEMEVILRTVRSTNNSRDPSLSSSSPIPSATSAPPMIVLDASESSQYWREPLQKIQDMLISESDRAEASWNEHRDEVALKVETIISKLDDAEVSRDGELSEGLAEMREWIVRHSAMQTENLRSIVEMLAAELKTTRDVEQNGSDEADNDGSPKDIIAGRTSASNDHSLARQPRANSHHHHDLLEQQHTDKFQELKDQLEMSSRVQMATFSEMADNLAGVEKMIRDMSQMMGVRRGGTILRKREQNASRAMLAMEVKETIQEIISSGGGSSASLVDSNTPPTSAGGNGGGFGGLFGGSSTSSLNLGLLGSFGKGNNGSHQSPSSQGSRRTSLERTPRDSLVALDQDKDQQQALAIAQQQQHYQWLESRVGELQTRKIRVELQVEQLEQDKVQLEAEKAQLAHEVELLRREKQKLLLPSPQNESGPTKAIYQPKAKADPLEGLLVDRVSMLLQETARLEALKRQLDNDVQARLGSQVTSSLLDHGGVGDDHEDDVHNYNAAETVEGDEPGEFMGAAEDEESEDLVLVDEARSHQSSPQTPSPRPSTE